MTLPAAEPFIVRDIVRLSHLFTTVQDHEARHGTPDAPGICDLEWRADSGWSLSIVCPGHYAFEEEGRADVGALIEEATAYYAERVRLWESTVARGCQERHPDPMPARRIAALGVNADDHRIGKTETP